MRITKMFPVAATLAPLLLATACDDRQGDLTSPLPSLQIVENRWEPFTSREWACNEPVDIEGKYHVTSSIQENGNNWHWRWHMRWIGSGVGEYSGSTYRFSKESSNKENLAAGWSYPLTMSISDQLTLVAQGPTADLHTTWQAHVTVNANGVETVNMYRWAFSCGDHGPPPFEGTLVVNVTDDLDDGSCDPTHCSLREALIASNMYYGTTETIAFRIPGNGPHTIQPRSGLPEVFDPVIIDGTTEPNFAGTPIVELDGSMAGEVNGLTILAGHTTVRGLVINRFGSEEGSFGLLLLGEGGSMIEGNYIGTDVSGSVALGNGGGGIQIEDSPDNVIGGTTPEARNLISGNPGNGVSINGGNATGNVVMGNYIGTDASGTAPLGNENAGVLMGGSFNNTVGGTAPGAGNLISGNLEGVTFDAASANLVQGNFIGTDASGTAALPNEVGILILGDENTIGGTTPNAENVISGNNGNGIALDGGVTANVILGNLIGTDVTGTVALGNGGRGIHLANASNTTVGSRAPGARNVISGNGDVVTGTGGGIMMNGAHGNTVRGNFIGTDVTGTAPLGNTGTGILMTGGASDNWIGGRLSGSGNVIAFNGAEGIWLTGRGGSGNAFLGNAIFENGVEYGLLGIDIDARGVTPNDDEPGDPDDGANGRQNFPELFAVNGTESSVTIEGALNSTPYTEFRIEFFANSVCDPSGHGEGESFIGAIQLPDATDENGDVSFVVTVEAEVPAGAWITATATDPDNNTSEFSACAEKVSEM